MSDIDYLDSYSRQNCIVLYGVNESNNENTEEILIKTFFEELDVAIKEQGLDRSHRLGKPKKDNKPRPIIIKFARCGIRKEIFMNKRKLKGKMLLISDSLTFSSMQLIDETKKNGIKNVWTSDDCTMITENK